MPRLALLLGTACICAGSLATETTGAAGCASDRVYPLTSAKRAYYAVVTSRATAYSRPGGRAVASFGRLNVNRAATVFGVLGAVRRPDCRPAWLRVQLPLRPNGVIGWVRADDVQLGIVRSRVLVDLSERRVSVYRGGEEVLRTRAAIGSRRTPTPTGRYYVNQRLRAIDPSGPFGPGGIGISAFSPVLRSWPQGGPVAIHGTNQPKLIGTAASNGCLRIENSVLVRMWDLAPEGTPVVIRP